mgnify:CR=1 FL=1
MDVHISILICFFLPCRKESELTSEIDDLKLEIEKVESQRSDTEKRCDEEQRIRAKLEKVLEEKETEYQRVVKRNQELNAEAVKFVYREDCSTQVRPEDIDAEIMSSLANLHIEPSSEDEADKEAEEAADDFVDDDDDEESNGIPTTVEKAHASTSDMKEK